MTQEELFEHVLQNDGSAIALMNQLAGVSQVLDDLIDQDKPIEKSDIIQTFLVLLSDLPRNSFYNQHLRELQPLIEMALIDWLTANQFEQDPLRLPVAWVLRDNLAAVLIGAAKIIGGLRWAIDISPVVRQFIHDEPLEEYRNGLNVKT